MTFIGKRVGHLSVIYTLRHTAELSPTEPECYRWLFVVAIGLREMWTIDTDDPGRLSVCPVIQHHAASLNKHGGEQIEVLFGAETTRDTRNIVLE